MVWWLLMAGMRGKILDFNQRLEISIDVAHALTYLHLYSGEPTSYLVSYLFSLQNHFVSYGVGFNCQTFKHPALMVNLSGQQTIRKLNLVGVFELAGIVCVMLFSFACLLANHMRIDESFVLA